MEITPETAFSAAQILSMLLIATMFDPWSKGAAGGRGVPRAWFASALVSYGAKVLALIVLLFDMQLVLFRISWTGGQGAALGIGNYFAIVVTALSLLLAVLSHMGTLGPAESTAAAEREGAAGRAEGTDRDGTAGRAEETDRDEVADRAD